MCLESWKEDLEGRLDSSWIISVEHSKKEDCEKLFSASIAVFFWSNESSEEFKLEPKDEGSEWELMQSKNELL